jgi:archaellum component FlaC
MKKTKTIKQLEKKQAKKEKEIHSKVKKEFNKRIGKQKKNNLYFNKQDNKKNNVLVDAITKSVILNKRMLGRDNYNLKRWQESYFQDLYAEFRKLVEKYNNGLQVKAEELSSKIADLKIEKRMLQADIKELETKKKILVNA